MEFFYLFCYPVCFLLRILSKLSCNLISVRKSRNKILLYPVLIVCYKRISHIQNLGSTSIILHHHDGLCCLIFTVKVHKELCAGTTPGIYGLVRITYYKKIMMISAQNLHKCILRTVNILELIYHDVFQSLLPLQFTLFIF